MSGNENVAFPDLADRVSDDSDGSDSGTSDSTGSSSDFGEELGGDPVGGTDPSDSSGTSGSTGSSSTSDFGEELGGDPVRDTDPEPSGSSDSSGSGSSDSSGTSGSTGSSSTSDFGEELGGDPAGDSDRDVDPDPTATDPDPARPASTSTGPAPDPGDVDSGESGTAGGAAPERDTPETVGDTFDGSTSSDSSSSDSGGGSDSSSSDSSDSAGTSEPGLDESETFTTENRSAVAEMEGRAPSGGVQVEEGVQLSDQELRDRVAGATEDVDSSDLEVLDATDGRVVVFDEPSGFANTSGTGFGGGTADAGGPATISDPTGFANTSATGFGGSPTRADPAEEAGEAGGSFPGVSSGSEGLNLLDPSEEKRARENAVDDINEQLDEQGSTVDVSASDLNVVGAGGEAVVTLDDETQRALAREDIRNQLSEETGVDLGNDDVTLEETGDGRFTGQLSESGRDQVEVENTPLAGVPLLGGITTSGTRARQGLRDVTDPVAEPVNQALPEEDSLLGLLGAAAPAAAAEPTLTGEAALGGAALLGGALIYGSGGAGALTGDDVSAGTETRIPEQSNTELTVPEESTDGELEPADEQIQEISVPEGAEQRLGPDELGLPQDELQDRELVGPEGTEVNDDGEVVIPAQAGGVVITRDTREKEDEEEEEDEEDEDEEEEEDEDSQSREEFLDEISPDETVVIGEPSGEASESGSSEESTAEDTELFDDVGEGTQSDDAEPDDTAADEEDPLEEIGVSDGTLSDDAEPDDTIADEEGPLDIGSEPEDVGETEPTSDTVQDFGIGVGAPAPSIIVGLIGSREQGESQQPEVVTGGQQSPILDELEDSQSDTEADLDGGQTTQEPSFQSETTTTSLLSADLSAPGLQSLFNETTTEATQDNGVTNETLQTQQFEYGVPSQSGSGGSKSGKRLRLPDGDGEESATSETVESDAESAAFDGRLTSGYFNEFTSVLAGVDRSAPDEDTLEEIASERTTTEALPTEGELEETAEFGDAAGFLSGEGTGVELDFSFEFGDDSDGGGFSLL